MKQTTVKNNKKMKKEMFFTEETIIAFHIGRGGKYNNAGFVTCLGEGKIGDYTDGIYAPTDDDGEEIDGEYTDDCGCGVGLTTEEVKSGIGTICIDGEYDTTYTQQLGDIDPYSKEAYAMVNYSDDFIREQAILYFLSEIHNEDAKKQLLSDLDVDQDKWEEYI